jgi:hypothetical protein
VPSKAIVGLSRLRKTARISIKINIFAFKREDVCQEGQMAKSRQLIQRVFKSLLECDIGLLVASAGQQEKGRAKARPFCFTNCCHGGFGYIRSYHRPQLLDRMERRRMAWGPYCKFLDRSEGRDPMSSAAETADDAASSQARGC